MSNDLSLEPRSKRAGRLGESGGSLSIVNSLDVLRNRLLLEIARKKAKEGANRNRQMLMNLGKRAFFQRTAGYYGSNVSKHTGIVPLFANAKKFSNKIALRDSAGSYTYGNIFDSAKELSDKISSQLNGRTNERVLFLCSNDVTYVISLWAIWVSGQIAVPLSPLHPQNILQYYANDTSSKLLVTTSQHKEIMTELSKTTNIKLYIINEELQTKTRDKQATGPKHLDGVVLSHKNLSVQSTTLLDAWKWSSKDVILHTLPLHHVHGTVNALFCPLHVGATTLMLPKFSAQNVWSHLLGRNKDLQNEQISVFMAVPTIYSKLVEEYEKNLKNERDHVRDHLQNKVRLMVSGSAPLPVPLYKKWLEISGQRLLERYGMTEIGMCLSNEYDSDRAPGYVGVPLPGVSIRLSENVNDSYKTLLECTNEKGVITFNKMVENNVNGELLVKGEGIFKEYFNKPEVTKKEFTEDGWFKTGDMCEYSPEKYKFRMLGRTSVDIIKSGGYKISALQIETKLLAHPDIAECVVLGISDDVWGEKIAAVIVPRSGSYITLDGLREWAADKMPKYSLPSVLEIVKEIPKNAMGKVNKKELVKSIFK
ncbi:hypothetical protein NQ314_000864 [Rhamnusium bicolor]|uniref:Corticotropin-releasing factor domain-containing protein n=1 Tax=Rhamnusium bicolor TaxID=1586634 RepID=A0AAV8ZVI2_9CUCU|nr:hypothetical protein NQ314_000864 [Rhamnusium bicolor]